MKILLINLDRSKDRLEEQNTQFQKLGLNFERFPATSIQDFNQDEYEELAFNGQRPLKQSELACFLSHKRTWEYVVQHNEPCVILEDDAVLVSDFETVINDIAQLTELDYVNLEVVGRRKTISKQPLHILNEYQLYKLYQDRNGTGGYVLFPSGAKKLLGFMEKRAIGLVDEYISSCRKLNSFQVEPAVLLQGVICPIYGIETEIDQGSVIGQVKNSTAYDLSFSQKLIFKKNRVSAQLVLAWYYLKYLLIGSKRLIEVDKSKFKN